MAWKLKVLALCEHSHRAYDAEQDFALCKYSVLGTDGCCRFAEMYQSQSKFEAPDILICHHTIATMRTPVTIPFVGVKQ